jgi:hypothetical protein
VQLLQFGKPPDFRAPVAPRDFGIAKATSSSWCYTGFANAPANTRFVRGEVAERLKAAVC